MKKYIILLVSVMIDGLIPNITLYGFNNITYFAPLCTVSSLVIIYDEKKLNHLLIISSIIYGILYIGNILLSSVLFFVIIFTIKYLKKIFKDNALTILFEIIIIIIVYEFLCFFIFSFIYSNNLDVNNFFYKVLHSIIFNLLYGLSIFYIYDKNSSKSRW